MPSLPLSATSRPTRLAFLVGGSEGIGAALAAHLVAEGADVVALSRSADKLSAAAAHLEGHRRTPAQRILTRPLDITDGAATRQTIDALVAELGTPDLVVDTAGYSRPGWLAELPDEHVRGMVEVNLLGTIHVCRAVLPHLVAAGRGTIVTTSSMAGLTGIFGQSVYCATKFGVIGFSEALSREVRRDGIRVLVLCPPNTRTPGFEEESRHKPAEVLAAEEKASTLTADEVAEALLRALHRRGGFLVVPGRDNQALALAMRHLPAVADRLLRRKPAPSVS